jgi:putative effector of murein hydrolase LrgA (UPF0299 family)
MTAATAPERSAGCRHQKRKRTTYFQSCEVSFAEDEVSVAVEQPADDVTDLCIAAHRQCLLRMGTVPPRTFTCVTEGNMSAPRAEIILQRSVLETVPLLLEMSNSTSNRQITSQLELPCSVWGFVSLLLLLERNVKLKRWFGSSGDTFLPSQTLLVCPSDRNPITLSVVRTQSVLTQKIVVADAHAPLLTLFACWASVRTHARRWCSAGSRVPRLQEGSRRYH